MDIWQYIIPAVSAVLVALLEVRGHQERKARTDESTRAEGRAIRRAEESRLSMELMSANCKLGLVTAKAVTGQHTNGDVEEAMTSARDAQEKYNDFLFAVAARQTAKV